MQILKKFSYDIFMTSPAVCFYDIKPEMVINRAKFHVCALSDLRGIKTYKGMTALISSVFTINFCFWKGRSGRSFKSTQLRY